ncbi:MAG: ABC transporter ATP-binding protein [Lachnospiraceae bacterium]|nr:ABC transporter ATP-binding protein [Lachnospiraceae bacterium]
MGEILRVTDVSVSFYQKKTEKKVLQKVSMHMNEGEILGLAGESGCGKSTLAKAIVGLVTPYEGEISCLGKKPQMIFQDPYSSLNPAKTVSWLLQEPLKLNTDLDKVTREQKVAEMMELVGLEENLLIRKPGELSGGQRQRVCIGMALMQNPEILIADEPVSALDVTIQAQVLALLKRIQKEKKVAILFISHDLRTMYHFCDRIMIMKNGKIEEEGEPSSLYRNPATEYTKLLLESAGIV